MKLEIKGFKGAMLRWLLPKLTEYVFFTVRKMTPALRQELERFIVRFEKKCKETENEYDDRIAEFIKEMIGF